MSPLSRRAVLTGGAAATASLLVPITVVPARAATTGETKYEITDWIMIAPSGQVTLGLSQPEVGRGRIRRCRRFWRKSSMRTGSASKSVS